MVEFAKRVADALAAREVDLDGVGLAHVQDLVGDRFDLFARVAHADARQGTACRDRTLSP